MATILIKSASVLAEARLVTHDAPQCVLLHMCRLGVEEHVLKTPTNKAEWLSLHGVPLCVVAPPSHPPTQPTSQRATLSSTDLEKKDDSSPQHHRSVVANVVNNTSRDDGDHCLTHDLQQARAERWPSHMNVTHTVP